MQQQRDITFDIMKGIGILLVITAHFFGWNHPIMGRSISSFHMPMFFIVAGYFTRMPSTLQEFRRNCKRYVNRLLPPYMFAQFCLVLWAILMMVVKDESSSNVIRESLSLLWADIDGPITQWGKLSIGVVWFLLALLISKILLMIISRLKVWAIPVSFALAIIAILIHKIFPYSIFCISIACCALPFVTIGWCCRTHSIPLWLKIAVVICWIFDLIFSGMDMYSFTWHCYPLNVLGACGGSYCLYLFCRFIKDKINFLAKALAILGIWSLAIMCFHYIEIMCRLGNHVLALVPVSFPMWFKETFRYILTIGLAGIAVNIPKFKKLFV